MGTKGWHSRGYLPHYDGWEITQHVVFRLFDSVPPNEIEGDDVLDRHFGACFMRDPEHARAVAETLLHDDGVKHSLQAWCVMPNHVHILVATGPLEDIGTTVRRWKTFSAKRINQRLDRVGSVWAKDYFDVFRGQRAESGGAMQAPVPLFVLGFLAMMTLRSAGAISEPAAALLTTISQWLLLISVVALGAKTALKDVLAPGPTPLIALTLQTILIGAFALAGVLLLF